MAFSHYFLGVELGCSAGIPYSDEADTSVLHFGILDKNISYLSLMSCSFVSSCYI